MNKRIIPHSRSKLKPTQAYPELLPHLAKVAKVNNELYELLKPSALGGVLGVSKQAVQKHIDKIKEKENAK